MKYVLYSNNGETLHFLNIYSSCKIYYDPKFIYSVYTTKFHSYVLWAQCKDIVKWDGNFFYRSSLSCFFLEKFRFEQYANISTKKSLCTLMSQVSYLHIIQSEISEVILSSVIFHAYFLFLFSCHFTNFLWIQSN